MYEIKNTSSVRNVMRVATVSGIELEPWGETIILRRVKDGVYISTYTVKYDEYKCWTKYAFLFDSHSKPLHQ